MHIVNTVQISFTSPPTPYLDLENSSTRASEVIAVIQNLSALAYRAPLLGWKVG